MTAAPPPHAPWHLTGECVVALVRARPPLSLPAGLRPMWGPSLVMGVRYADSPVGPYLELAVAHPARLGIRPGLCVTTMVVTSADSRVGGIVNWGFPKQLGTLEWSAVDDGVELWWRERGLRVVCRPFGRFGVPGLAPIRSLQRRADGNVVVPGRIRGFVRPARVTVTAPPSNDDGLAAFDGSHVGMQVRGVRLTINPARVPTGLASSLRAPLQAPEPALSWLPVPTGD